MVWPAWVVQAIWFVATTIISIALAPRPPNRKAAALEDFQVPTAEEGRSIPVVFGTVRITGPNVVWYGDLDKKAIRKSTLFSSTVVGYKYYLGLHYVLGFGPFDEIARWEWDDKTAWSGSITASSSDSISLRKLFGGENGEGGLAGSFDVAMGEASQTANAYLLSKIGAPISAYRGVVSFIWKGGYVGNSQYLKPVTFTVRRTAAGWEGGTAWNAADVTIDGGMNPAHLVYEILTNSNFGYGEPTASIDETSFGIAADTFVSENYGLNLQWVHSEELESFLAEVCSHAGMVLSEDPTSGKYVLKLLRDNYVAADLDLVDESTVIDLVRYSRQGWGETVNEVTVLYTDPDSFKTTGVTVHDLGNIRSQGRVIAQTIQFPGIKNHDVANAVAARELAQRSTPLGRGTIRCSRRAWAYQQGDVFRFSWEKEGIVESVHRVMAIRKGTLEDGSIEIDIAEDIFGLPSATYTESSAIDAVPTPPAEPDQTGTTDGSVLSVTTTAPPGVPTDGDSYYVPTGATGAWAGHAGEIATWAYDDDTASGEWVFETVAGEPIVHVSDDDEYVVLDGAGSTTAAPWDLTIPALAWKAPVRVATTVAGTLATSFENGDTVDGVTLATGDRILIKDQVAPAENGIYVVAASGAPARAADADSADEVLGATVVVSEGTANAEKQFTCSTNAPITLGSTALVFGRTGGPLVAEDVTYDNATSGLAATNVQDALDELESSISSGAGSGNALHVQDQKATSTAGGASTDNAWNTRTLNTEVLNTITGASLASNQVTLPAGTYDIDATAPGHQCEGHQTTWYNVTDTAYTLFGTSARSRQTSSSDGSSVSRIRGRFTIAAEKTFELRHWTAQAQATNGLGSPVNSGAVEVYADVFIVKV